MSLLGTGRVWSLMMMVAVALPFASSQRRGEAMGESMAARTRSLPLLSLLSSSMREVRMASGSKEQVSLSFP